MENKQNTKETEEEKVARLKKIHGVVYTLTVKDEDDNDVIAYLKEPDLSLIDKVVSRKEAEPVFSMKMLLENTIIKEESNMRIVNENELMVSCIPSLNGILIMRQSSLKKN